MGGRGGGTGEVRRNVRTEHKMRKWIVMIVIAHNLTSTTFFLFLLYFSQKSLPPIDLEIIFHYS